LTDTMYDASITSPDEAARIGMAEIAARSDSRIITFKTYEPGLRAGQQIGITNSGRGLADDQFVIQKVATRYLGASAHAQFTITAGTLQSDFLDIIGVAYTGAEGRPKEDDYESVSTFYTVYLDGETVTLSEAAVYYISE